MSSLYPVIETFLAEEEWPFEYIAEHSVFHFGIANELLSLSCYIQLDDDAGIAVVCVCLPMRVDEGSRISVAEFLTRANFGARIGNFEFDMDDGEIRYKCSMDVEGGEMTVPMLRNMFCAAMTAIEYYYPSLMSVTFGHVSPRDAVEHAHNPITIPDEI